MDEYVRPMNSYSFLTLSLIAVTTLTAVAGAGEYTEYRALATLPSPLKNSTWCGNNATGYICDPEKILPRQHLLDLNEIIKAINEESTKKSKPCLEEGDGFIFSVAVAGEIVKREDISTDLSMKELAEQLRVNWKMGACGNDAVLLLVTSRNKIYNSMGHFMRKKLKPKCVENIIKQSQHHISARNWSELLSVLLLRFKIGIKHGCETPDDTASGTIVAAVVSSTLIGTGLIFFCCCKCHPNRGKGTFIQVSFIGKRSPSYGGADGWGEFTEIDGVDGGTVVARTTPGTSEQNAEQA